MMSTSDSSEDCSLSDHTVKGEPPPVPKTPPNAGRVLALKYYKKVSKSISKGFSKKSSSHLNSTTATSTSNSIFVTSAASLQHTIKDIPIEHVYEIIPPNHNAIPSLECASKNSSFEEANNNQISEDDEKERRSSTNESGPSEYGSAEEGLENDSIIPSACYENVMFSRGSKSKIETGQKNNLNPNLEEISEKSVENAQKQVPCGFLCDDSSICNVEEEEEDDSRDTSCGDTDGSCKSNCNLCNEKSSDESSSHFDSNSNTNLITTIQTTKTTLNPMVHRTPPPPIPKFPSSTESSSADDSFSSCSSKPGILPEVAKRKTEMDGPGDPSTSRNTTQKNVCSKSILALSQQTNEITCYLDPSNETKAKIVSGISGTGFPSSSGLSGLFDSSTTTSAGDDDDEKTEAPDDNDADDEIIELDEDEVDTSVKTEEYEDLVQAVTQTLTLTLNNKSNSLLVSMPSSSSPGGSCNNNLISKINKNGTLKATVANTITSKTTTTTTSSSKATLRPETGPGDDETDHEYQNVFVQKGRFITRTISYNDEDNKYNEETDNFESDTGSMSINRVILSESGVTTIEEGHAETYQYDDDAVPVVHAVINLPPRMMNLIRQRRRKTSEDITYEKSSRLSRLMMADFKAGERNSKPSDICIGTKLRNNSHSSSESAGSGGQSISDGNISSPTCKSFANKARSRLSETGSKVTNNVEKVGKSVSTMRRKVGSWYLRRVKTPVKQMSTEFGIPGITDANNFKSKEDPGPGSTSGDFGDARRASRVNIRPKSSMDVPTDLDFDEGDYSVVTGEYSFPSDNVNGGCEEENKEANNDLIKKGQNEFEDLRRLVKQGGDFCKDLSAVLIERSELESQYAKGLSKLSAKLLKASKEATGSVAHAWQAVAVQIDTQAELHRQWSTGLSEELAKPLRNSSDTQHKIRKSVEVLVEKTTRNLADWRTAEAKAKRQCFSSSKEFEKLQESSLSILGSINNATNGATTNQQNNANSNNSNNANNSTTNSNSVLSEVRSRSRLLSVPPMDKDPMKLEAKRRKAEEAVRRADIEYYTFCVRSERARLEWEGAIRNGSTCLRTLEEEKLSLLRDLALKYFQHLNDFAPKLVHSVETLEEPLKACSVNQDMHSIVDIRRHVGAEQLLPDFYAEDVSNLMKKDRRLEALQKFLYLIKQDLERERKGATGVETLAKAIAEAPKIDPAHHDISDKLYYMRSMLLYLEASRCKLDNAIYDVEGRQRSNNPITQYMRHQRDKQGLPQTILKVPSWAREDCLAYSISGAGSAGSSSPDWNDRRGNGDGTSGQQSDFDEFGSEGSGSENCENIEVFGDENATVVSVTNNRNLISVPSIGKCRAIYDYDANLFDELTIRVGDEINIHDKQEDGWWLGEMNGGVIGIFPATYVEEIPLDPSPISS